MRNVLDAGFVFWGLFLVFAMILGAYVLWMSWEEGRAGRKNEDDTPSREVPE